MRLFAISDLHVGYEVNREAVLSLGHHSDDWLILAGDVGETKEHLEFVLQIACARFHRVIWVPGNHDLWTITTGLSAVRGQAKYEELVGVCRRFDVLTPEDPFSTFKGAGGPCVIAPLFTLYDYSFRPDDVTVEKAVAWAMEAGILSADEELLHFEPFASRADWCAERCRTSEARLQAAQSCGHPLVFVSHFPLLAELVRVPLLPRFSIWCGTRATASWHRRFNAKVAVSGHLHVRATDWVDGVRFEEVSLGYPRQWDQARGLDHYLRVILPQDSLERPQSFETVWRR